MNLKWQYGLFTAALLGAIAVLVFCLFRESLWYLALAEAILVVFIVFAFGLYTKIFRPFAQLKLGSEALQNQDFTNKMRLTDSAEMNNLVRVYNDVIENIRKERLFQQEQHYFLKLLVDALPVGILILDYDDQLSEFNPEAQKILALKPEHVGSKMENINHQVGEAISRINFNETSNFRIDGNTYYRCLVNKFMHRGFARKFIILEDIRKEVIDIEKKSYGKVIRMMAHEVHNSVGAVNSILESLLTYAEIDEKETREYLEIILDRNQKLNRFMQNFADVVRIPPPHLARVNLNNLIRRVYRLMESQSGHTAIEFQLVVPDFDVFVKMDVEQIEQVLINAILNAIEAIDGPGQITVELKTEPSLIRITDTGSGISPDNAEKIFTPFYSNKATGQGIGLTMIREILNNHDFRYDLRSENGVTVFEVEV